MRITIRGARGSCPVSGPQYLTFGGSTSCYMVEAAGETIFLDGGSGLVGAPCDCARPPAILLSHLHIDHLLGLGMYGRLSRTGERTDVYVPAGTDEEAAELLALLYTPPLWPLRLSAYGGDVHIRALPDVLHIGDVTVETQEGSHPGGCKLMRLSCAGKKLVYATDFEHDEEATDRLVAFAQGADALLYDGQYSPKSYPAHRGFGHSTPEEGIAVLERSCARRLIIVHHDPLGTDDVLLAREAEIGRADVHFAREGEVIEL